MSYHRKRVSTAPDEGRDARQLTPPQEFPARLGTPAELDQLRAAQAESIITDGGARRGYPEEHIAGAVDPPKPRATPDEPPAVYVPEAEEIRRLVHDAETLNDAALNEIFDAMESLKYEVPQKVRKREAMQQHREAIKSALVKYAFDLEIRAQFEAKQRRRATLDNIRKLTARLTDEWSDDTVWHEIGSRLTAVVDYGGLAAPQFRKFEEMPAKLPVGRFHLPPGADLRAYIKQVRDIATALLSEPVSSDSSPRHKKPINRYILLTLSPLALLQGRYLPQIYEQIFERRPGRSRDYKDDPERIMWERHSGPCVRYVSGVLTRFNISHSTESIAKAIGAQKKLSEKLDGIPPDQHDPIIEAFVEALNARKNAGKQRKRVRHARA